MRKFITCLLSVTAVLALLTGCGEKPCNREGATRAENGKLFYCADRKNGNGLRWYPAAG